MVAVIYQTNRWIDVDSNRLRVPTESVHVELESFQPSRFAGESIYDYVARQESPRLKYLDEAVNAVTKVRQMIETILIQMDMLPGVLHPLISHYAI
jgi:hypothetical protein